MTGLTTMKSYTVKLRTVRMKPIGTLLLCAALPGWLGAQTVAAPKRAAAIARIPEPVPWSITVQPDCI